MSEPDTYYLYKLYPLQDIVLSNMTDIKSKFYLTDGTTVSRFMLHHRYSDDLDFFLNSDNDFPKEAERVVIRLNETFKKKSEVTYRSLTFYRIIIKSDEIGLKLDLVNDVSYHSGGFFENDRYHKIDNERNILSNKVTALQRNAPKDVADILYLSFKYNFNWMDIIEDAKKKIPG